MTATVTDNRLTQAAPFYTAPIGKKVVMAITGAIVGAFLVYHLLHLTVGTVHPSFEEGHVYDNVVAGFRVVPVSIAYIVAMILLGMHLNHGVWSMFQSLGVSHPRYSAGLRRFANIFSVLVTFGFISVPLAVMTGIVS